ncbi:MAG: S8 family peptidase [Paludibacteraceae bacterium]|nr:S8 family peptidase [Paludibacteraceae bacterium]
MKKLAILSILLTFTILSIAQESKLSPFSRSFIDTRDQLNTEKNLVHKKFALKTIGQQEYVSAYIYLANYTADISFLESYGVIIDHTFDSILTVKIPVEQLEPLSQSEKVSYIEIGTPVAKKMSYARTAAKVDKVQAGTDLSHPFLGTGVIVGIIDYGFQYNHINFYDENDNYTTLRVKQVWDQSHDKKYTTQTSIETAQYDDDNDDTGHATHVAGIATGSYSGNSNYGIAKNSDIIMVSYGTTNTDITNGIKYIYDYATSVNKPAVVNMSLGSHQGPHDGTSTFDITCDNMQGPGRLLVGSAGNEGNMKLYREESLNDKQSSLKYVTFEKHYDQYSVIDIWGDNNQKYTVQIVILNDANETLYTSSAYNATISGNYSLTESNYGSTYASGKISIYTAKSRNSTNAKGNVLVYLNGFSIKTGYKLGIKYNAITAGTIKAWGTEYELYWANGQTTSTMGEIGGTGKRIITSGAYTTFARYTGSYVKSIASFSSKGPTADGRMKPDITAPGDAIVSSIPDITSVTKYADSKTSETIGDKTYYWAYMSGTSMATPFVTGVLATWLEANPQLTPEKVREVLSTTSMTDTYTGTCPNNTWGYGKIDAYEGLLKVIATTPIQNLETMPDAIMLYPNPNNGSFKLLFTKSDENVLISVYTANGQQVLTKQIRHITMQENLSVDLGAITSGAYVVKVSGNKINETLRLLVR